MKLFAAILAAASVASVALAGPQIQTKQGVVEGASVSNGAVNTYYGIPFAAPPVGM